LAATVACLLVSPALGSAHAVSDESSRSATSTNLLSVSAPPESEQELAAAGEEALAVESEAEEQEEREAETEAEGQEATPHHRRHPVECVVPAIAGGTLPDARRALLKAHCSLGKVSAPHSRHGSLVVVWQSRSHGSRLARGSAVSVRLALKSARPARRANLK
jgi:hypothetical protein